MLHTCGCSSDLNGKRKKVTVIVEKKKAEITIFAEEC